MFLRKTLMGFLRKFPNNHTREFAQNASEELQYKKLTGSDEGIAVMAMNRPKQKNAFSMSLVNEISNVVDQVSADNTIRTLVIRSLVPGVFCAGADLKERSTMTPDQVSSFVTNLRSLLSRIYNLPIPVIAAIDGVALGGGLELALACDIRIASASAKMGLVETKLAIIPGAGGTQRLTRIVGTAISKELIFTSKVVDGEKAHSLGLVNDVVKGSAEADAAYQKSLELAREIIPNGPIAIRMAKMAINRGIEVDLTTGLQVEEACYAQVIPTKDRTEGLNAFKEKRKPCYLGC